MPADSHDAPREVLMSVDVEASGPAPGRYSLLAIGACPFVDPTLTFYAELKPVGEAATAEDWRKAYEEAAAAARFAASPAEAEALIGSADPGSQARGENLKAYVRPNLQLMAAPLAVDPAYANPDGSYDIPRRFADLEADTEGPPLDPQASFARAVRLASQQRWLVVGRVLLAVSLFWLAMAQISRGRRRMLSFLVGLAFFGTGALWFAIVALAFAILPGGAR